VTYINLRRALPTVLGIAALGLLAGCSEAPVTPGELGRLQQVAASCPADVTAHHQTRVDVSGSGERSGLSGTTRQVVSDAIERTAICGGGTYSLVVFSAGTAHTASVFESTLTLQGATENARLRRMPALLEETLEQIDQAYPDAVAALTDGSTDVVAQLSGAAEFAAQVTRSGEGEQLVAVTIRTDGIGTAGTGSLPTSITTSEAVATADAIAVPDLSAVDQLTFSGIGQVSSGTAPSTAYVEALKAFYQRLGERTGAGSVLVVTEHLEGR